MDTETVVSDAEMDKIVKPKEKASESEPARQGPEVVEAKAGDAREPEESPELDNKAEDVEAKAEVDEEAEAKVSEESEQDEKPQDSESPEDAAEESPEKAIESDSK